MKNYTSTVPVERTIARIEKALAKAETRNIIKDFDKDGEVASLRFSLYVEAAGKTLMIQLPANIQAVETVLLSQRKRRPTQESRRFIRAQAVRTAWKIMQDWVEVQLSLIELQQVEALQVFLPYVWCGQQTYYAMLREGGFRLLGPAAKESDHA